MELLDVNVLVYAHREDAEDHPSYRSWVEGVANGSASFSITDLVFSGFLRVVTHPRIFSRPTPLLGALEMVEQLRRRPNFVPVAPGRRHWDIFTGLVRTVRARGNLIPDAFHAAIASETGSEWITTDRGFARFPGLRVRHPLHGS